MVGGCVVLAEVESTSKGIMAWAKMNAALLRYQGCLEGGGVHLTFPVGLEGGKGEVEEGTRKMVAVSTAEIEYCGCDRDTQFLDVFGRLTSIKPKSRGGPFSYLPHLDNRLEDQLTKFRKIKGGNYVSTLLLD